MMPCVHARRPHTGEGGWRHCFGSSCSRSLCYWVAPGTRPLSVLTRKRTQSHTRMCVCSFFTHAKLPAQLMTNRRRRLSLPRSLQVFCYFYAFYSIKKIVVYREGQKKQKQKQAVAVAASATPFIETTTTPAAAATLTASSQLLYILREKERHTQAVNSNLYWK